MNQDVYTAERKLNAKVQEDADLLERIRADHEQRQRAEENSSGIAAATVAKPVADRETPWPTLAEDALYGLAGDVVRAIDPYTEADPVLTLANVLAGFGSLIGRGPHAKVLANEHPARLFFAQVGETSKGRKGLALNPILQMLRAVDPTWKTASGLSSGEGLINAVRDAVREWKPVKGNGSAYEEVETDPGVTDKRLLIVEPEFAVVLKAIERSGNTLSSILRNCWDGETLSPLTKNNRISATGAHISIVAQCTVEELTRYLTETERANGFANRFVFLLGRRSKEIPNPRTISDSVLKPLIGRLRAACEFSKEVSEVIRDKAAESEWAEAYGALSAGKPGMVGAIIARAEAQVLRLSVAYALLDCSTVILPEHQGAAIALWDYAEASARYIFGDSTGNPVADSILRALRTKGEMDRTEISALFGRNRSTDTIQRALDMLARARLAHGQSMDTDGRKREVWRPGPTN